MKGNKKMWKDVDKIIKSFENIILTIIWCITGLIAFNLFIHTYNFNHAQDFNEAIKHCKEQTFCQQQVAATYQAMYGKYQQTDLRHIR